MVSMLLAFFPTFNLNSMHYLCPSESPAILVTKKKCMLVIAASLEATVQVISWQQIDWNSCRLLLFLDKLK